MAEHPDLGELLAETVAAARGGMFACIPAQIVTYNPALQTASVKPTVSGRYQDAESGLLIPYPLPVIANVPVGFPCSGLMSIVWELLPGDEVLLVIADRSLDEWKSTGAPENIPQDVRRFDLTDAIALPMVHSIARPIPADGWSPGAMVLRGLDIRLGSALALSPVALAPLQDAVNLALSVWLATHTHTVTAVGSPTSPPVVPPPIAGSVAAVKVKAE